MPTHQTPQKTLEQVVEECGRYPIEAFEFVRLGLNHTVQQIHGLRAAKSGRAGDAGESREPAFHVSGQQLCRGLRTFALQRYGLMAGTVLRHWGLNRTDDFGRIVFAMVDSKLMQKTDDDDIRDFHNVFDFAESFSPPPRPQSKPIVVFHF